MNPIAWNVWHAARVEDVGVNAFIADRPQVMHSGGWLDRLKSSRRDVGTGMTDAEVDALCGAIDLDALREYWEAVSRATLEVVESLRGQSLTDVVPAHRVGRVRERAGRGRPQRGLAHRVLGEGAHAGVDAGADAAAASVRPLVRGPRGARAVGLPESVRRARR